MDLDPAHTTWLKIARQEITREGEWRGTSVGILGENNVLKDQQRKKGPCISLWRKVGKERGQQKRAGSQKAKSVQEDVASSTQGQEQAWLALLEDVPWCVEPGEMRQSREQ